MKETAELIFLDAKLIFGWFVGMICAIFLAAAFLPAAAWGAVTGKCSDCHTMHNSQLGAAMLRPSSSETGPLQALLRDSCLGCHTGVNTATSVAITAAYDAPFVLGDGTTDYSTTGTEGSTNTLAGGNFYWVDAGDDNKGHNVTGLGGGSDGAHANTPPGGDALTGQLTCAGTVGCHGDRSISNPYLSMHGTHHESSDATVSSSHYRILDGISGLEDADWEWRPDKNNHNQYKGVARTSDDDEDTTTISSFCATCHNDFHNDDRTGSPGTADASYDSPWLRHPIDIDMNGLGGEYANYNSSNEYSVIAPLASSSVASVNSTVLAGAGDAIVMCISCHRAHGSPYDDIMRWDYKGTSGNWYNGCAICHTTKD